MCIYIYIFIYLYIYTHTHTYLHTYIHTYIHTYTHTDPHICVQVAESAPRPAAVVELRRPPVAIGAENFIIIIIDIGQ